LAGEVGRADLGRRGGGRVGDRRREEANVLSIPTVYRTTLVFEQRPLFCAAHSADNCPYLDLDIALQCR
jgi:hypothetical protein